MFWIFSHCTIFSSPGSARVNWLKGVTDDTQVVARDRDHVNAGVGVRGSVCDDAGVGLNELRVILF